MFLLFAFWSLCSANERTLLLRTDSVFYVEQLVNETREWHETTHIRSGSTLFQDKEKKSDQQKLENIRNIFRNKIIP